MKEKVIETAGRAWRFLAENGETNVEELPKKLKVDEPFAYQALGWLAREDKINYVEKKKKPFVSLIASELEAFQSTINNIQTTTTASPKKITKAGKTSAKRKK